MVSWETAQSAGDRVDPTKNHRISQFHKAVLFLLKDLGNMSSISQEPLSHYLHESSCIVPKILPEDYKSWKKLQKVPDVKDLGVFVDAVLQGLLR